LNQFKDKKQISKEDFFNTFRYYNLTHQEMLELFSFANIKKDGILNQDEWNAFVQLFVKPFVNCDYNKD